MIDQLNQIQKDFLSKISESTTLSELDEIFLSLFGKNGHITVLPKEFSTLSKDEIKEIGPFFNTTKTTLEEAIEEKRAGIREAGYAKLTEEKLDLESTVKERVGRIHPITEFEDKIASLFQDLGFQQFDAPFIDSDQNNFEKLNIPEEHPARDMWDTLYIDAEKFGFESGKLLLRTHTSNAQVHAMNKFKPPLRIMNIGRAFRYENLDARHEHTFDQFELIYVDKGVSMANLQFLSEYLLKKMYGEDIKVRLSPGYYPFTEPSGHIFGTCIFCMGEGCKICGTGELELGGCGMIHPNVLKNCGIDPEEYSGIAWGVGPGRMAMLKYDVSDVRLFNSADLKFLQSIGKGENERVQS